MKAILSVGFFFLCTLIFAQNPYVSITLVQDEQRITINEFDTLVILKPTPFRFEIELSNCEGVFIQASRTSEYYDTPKDSLLKDWIYIPDKVMAEDDFNVDKDMLVDNDGFSYWFYDPKKDWHRFDNDIKVKKNVVKATYTVSKIYDTALHEQVELSDYLDTLYLLFFIAKENESHQLTTELARKLIRIRFQ
ncbi:MAG: hypothetical protein RI922_1276 [Bacteroidota bacterium]|jgi:hypothetical protein